MNNKKSKRLYLFLVTLFACILITFGDFDIEKFKNINLWLLLYIITLHIYTQIMIEDLSIIRVHTSEEIILYKIRLHRLYENQINELEKVRENWRQITTLKYANDTLNDFYFIKNQLDDHSFHITVEEIYQCVLADKYIDLLNNH